MTGDMSGLLLWLQLLWIVCFADPFLNDVNFVLSVLTLEEGGATGNKVRIRCSSVAVQSSQLLQP